MGFIVILIIFSIIVGCMFISVKINNLKYRAGQQLLKNTGISSSDIHAGITEGLEKGYLEKFLREYPNFTETTIKDLLKQYASQILNKNSIHEFSQAVYEKMQKDSKLDKMQNMEFKRTNISYYGNSKLNAIVVFSDNRDEYELNLYCSILGDRIQLDGYRILKGAVIGF